MKLSAKTLSGVLHGLNRNSCDWYVLVTAPPASWLAAEGLSRAPSFHYNDEYEHRHGKT